MFGAKINRPYFEKWLRRTGRQLAASGRLSQLAQQLASEEAGSAEFWRLRLRRFLEGGEIPSLAILTKIDILLAGRAEKTPKPQDQEFLW